MDDEPKTLKATRRFIAGAICPACRAQDRIVVEQAAAGARRYCIQCSFSETLESQSPAPSLPTSRLLKTKPDQAVVATPVRILEPGQLAPVAGRARSEKPKL